MSESAGVMKPCPFCGNEPRIIDDSSERPYRWIVRCGNGNGGCRVIVEAIAPTKYEAIERWNRRS